MRNLKKILALVLALVMSLSLMATAGAKDFTDKADIEATGYQAAVDVLAELEVIRGYDDGSYKPNGDITRAEVAALIYRIVTKDTQDAQVSIYSNWKKFSDVKDADWHAGYVNYCANAEIIKGNPDGTFNPSGKVTGYQVLTMILRAMGYGKNGEFVGANWSTNTAARAQQIGLIDNVLAQKLNDNATRALVSEILFRALLTETVDYNAITGYQPNGKTLGQTQFGLEEITGVVVANEYADLENDSPLAAGKTHLKVDKKNYVLNVATGLTDIGESRTAYVQKTSQNTFKVYSLADSGLNNRKENDGDAVSSVRNYAKAAGLDISKAEHFQNFGFDTVSESDYRIEYQIGFKTKADREWFAEEYDVDPDKVLDNDNRFDTVKGEVFTRVIPKGNEITAEDIAIMEGIFSVASEENHESVETVGITGYVYVGTAKGDNEKERDLSSEMSWRAFKAEYLYSETGTEVKDAGNGDWLKIVDNDGDGMAEYVFKTVYHMEEVLSKNNKTGLFTLGYYDDVDEVVKHIDSKKIKFLEDVEVGDVVLAALIDGKWLVEKAPEAIKVIQTISYRDKTVTTTEGDVYEQSDITAHVNMGTEILDMANKVEYIVYFDHFGKYVRAYDTDHSSVTKYALLSELYHNYDRNGKYLKDQDTIVEIKMGEADLDEKYVTNWASTSEKGEAYWFEGVKNGSDLLQRAINHLGVNTVRRSVDGYNGEFRYPKDNHLADTNVAVYVYDEDEDTVEIYPAAQYAENRAGEKLFYSEYKADGSLKTNADNLGEKVTEDIYKARYNAAHGDGSYAALANKWTVLRPVYAVDYVKLDTTKNITGKQVRYDMDKADASWNEYGMYTGTYQGNYVNATRETEYYVVNPSSSKISYYVGYAELPEFEAEQIRAMYAVATNTTAAKDEADYWVADVIVIEATGTKADDHDSVALAYFNNRKTTGEAVKYLDALDNETKDPQVTLVPKKEGWKNQWTGYGFYALYTTEVAEPDITAGTIKEITSNYNDYGINAGLVYRYTTVSSKGGYIMVDRYTNGVQTNVWVDNDVPVYGIVDYTQYYGDWDLYELSVDELKAGDKIIYVYNNSGKELKYIVLADFNTNEKDSRYDEDCDPNDWTEDLWLDIYTKQTPDPEKRTLVPLTFNLTGDETVVVTCYDGGKQVKTADKDNKRVEIWVNNPDQYTFTLKGDVAALMVPNGYTRTTNIVPGTTDEYTVTVSKDKVQTSSGRAVPVCEAYTTNFVVEIIKEISVANIGSTGAITWAEAGEKAAELLAIVANMVSTEITFKDDAGKELNLAGEATDIGADVTAEIAVEALIAEDPELANKKEELKEAVKEAVKKAVETSEPVSEETIVDIVDEAVQEAIVENTKVNVTLKADTAGLVKMTVTDADGKAVAPTDDVYTVEKDTVLTVVLVSDVELDETAPVTVMTDGTVNVTKIELAADKKTVTITLPAAKTDVAYKFTLNPAAK